MKFPWKFRKLVAAVLLARVVGSTKVTRTNHGAAVRNFTRSATERYTLKASSPQGAFFVTVFGGSMTKGTGTNCSVGGHWCAWPHLLQEMLQKSAPGATVVNRAVGGSSLPGSFQALMGAWVADSAAATSSLPELVLIDYSVSHLSI